MNTIAIPHADKGYTAISQINKLEEYIFNLFCNLEKHIIFITSSDAHVPQNLKNRKLELLKSLGLCTNLQTAYRHSFLAVIDRGDVKIELSNANQKLNAEYSFNNHRIKIISQGFNAAPVTNSPISINIDDREYAVNKRGLNIVVWDFEKIVLLTALFLTHSVMTLYPGNRLSITLR